MQALGISNIKGHMLLLLGVRRPATFLAFLFSSWPFRLAQLLQAPSKPARAQLLNRLVFVEVNMLTSTPGNPSPKLILYFYSNLL